jgi:hypothetical protein
MYCGELRGIVSFIELDQEMKLNKLNTLKLPLGTFSDKVRARNGGSTMATNVKLSDELVAQASRIATIEHRSIPKQIEFYFKIAAIAEENPELSFKLIKEILKADSELESIPYKFG